MKPRDLLATAHIPKGDRPADKSGDELRLYRRGEDYTIALAGPLGDNELMSSRMSGSEEALALMTCERLGRRRAPHLLVGGYGMGFTLRAGLGALGPDARVSVVELVPEIIEWARGPMAALTAGCLEDPRVELIVGDVSAAIAAGRGRYDAILLDVDNGPQGLTRAANDRLYSPRGLFAAKAALKPRGLLAIWTAAPDARFSRRLQDADFEVEEASVRARSNGKGARHLIWFATPL